MVQVSEITLLQGVAFIGFIFLVVGYLLGRASDRKGKNTPNTDRLEARGRPFSNAANMDWINYIISDDYDRAIEAYARTVEMDADTVDPVVTLGNLFRTKGEIDRAIRLRQSILQRPDLDDKILVQTLYELGLDYYRGGFYQRAIQTFDLVLEKNPRHLGAIRELTRIYEDTREWEEAREYREKEDRIAGTDSTRILAHYYVEIGKSHYEKGKIDQALSAYRRALRLYPGCVDAYLNLGDLRYYRGQHKKAMAAWKMVIIVAPDMFFLILNRLAMLSTGMESKQTLEDFLTTCIADQENPLVHLLLSGLLRRRGDVAGALSHLKKALGLDPHLFEAHREMALLLMETGQDEETLTSYRELLDNLSSRDVSFQCDRCGFRSSEIMWRCPQCGQWDTMYLQRHHILLFGPDESRSEDLDGLF